MKNHPKQVQNERYDNFSKIRTKTAVFKNYGGVNQKASEGAA